MLRGWPDQFIHPGFPCDPRVGVHLYVVTRARSRIMRTRVLVPITYACVCAYVCARDLEAAAGEGCNQNRRKPKRDLQFFYQKFSVNYNNYKGDSYARRQQRRPGKFPKFR